MTKLPGARGRPAYPSTGAAGLVEALERTSELLAESEDSDYSAWSAKEARAEIDQFVAAIKANKNYDATGLAALFMVTGPVQEIAMANGWAEEMIRLAEVVDKAGQKPRPWWHFWKPRTPA
jgi:hypothetical protein